MGLNRNNINGHIPKTKSSFEKRELIDNIVETIETIEKIKEIELPTYEIKKEDKEKDFGFVGEFEATPTYEIEGVHFSQDNKYYVRYNEDNTEILEEITEETVICENDKSIYKDNKEASELTSVNQSSIKRCCNGDVKSAGKDKDGNKLVWKYLNDFLKNKEK